MKVKVGNMIYDGDTRPVMVILTREDKENIASMGPGDFKYCTYPKDSTWDEKKARAWMDEE